MEARTTAIITKSAGSRRRARRIQNRTRSMVPVALRSASSSDVIRKPLITRKTSTPRKPPGSQPAPMWYVTTAATATARSPSTPGMYGERGAPEARGALMAEPPGDARRSVPLLCSGWTVLGRGRSDRRLR